MLPLTPTKCHYCRSVFLFDTTTPVETPYTCPSCARMLERDKIIQMIKHMPLPKTWLNLNQSAAVDFKNSILKELEG